MGAPGHTAQDCSRKGASLYDWDLWKPRDRGYGGDVEPALLQSFPARYTHVRLLLYCSIVVQIR